MGKHDQVQPSERLGGAMSRLGAVGALVVAVIGFRMAGWLRGGSNYYAPGPSFTGTLLEIVGVLVVAVIGL